MGQTKQLQEIGVSVGCERCNHSGYQGRAGIYELISMDEMIKTLIHDNAGEQELTAHARTSSPSLRDDGFRLLTSGHTTLEEILRVTQQD